MPRVSRSECFAGTDDTPLSVAEGVFDAHGVDHQRTGASNARAVTDRAGWFGFHAASQQQRVNLVTLVAVLALITVLLPMVISIFGSARREAILAAERAADDRPQFIVIDPAVEDAKNSANQALGAYAMSSTYVPKDIANKMRDLLEKVSTSVRDNDAGKTRGLADEAKKYFLETYAPALAKRAPELADEWGEMDWDTYSGIEDQVAALQGALPGKDYGSISKQVIELANLLGQGKDQHFQNRVTYVPPPPPPPPPAPTQEPPKPAETAKPNEQPKQPAPSQPPAPQPPAPQPPQAPQPSVKP